MNNKYERIIDQYLIQGTVSILDLKLKLIVSDGFLNENARKTYPREIRVENAGKIQVAGNV